MFILNILILQEFFIMNFGEMIFRKVKLDTLSKATLSSSLKT